MPNPKLLKKCVNNMNSKVKALKKVKETKEGKKYITAPSGRKFEVRKSKSTGSHWEQGYVG